MTAPAANTTSADDALSNLMGAALNVPAPGAPASPVSTVEQGDVQDERPADACPRCDGSGEITVMSDNSPDAHDVDICCDHCQGSGAAVDAAKYLAAALAGEKHRHMQLWAEYQNFHRSLCARFGHPHDSIHFRRDLVSLEEAIAAKVSAPAAGDAQIDRDAAFEAVRKRLCAIPRYSFYLDDDGVVRRVEGRNGNWIEFDAAQELFDPVCVEAAIAAQRQGDA